MAMSLLPQPGPATPFDSFGALDGSPSPFLQDFGQGVGNNQQSLSLQKTPNRIPRKKKFSAKRERELHDEWQDRMQGFRDWQNKKAPQEEDARYQDLLQNRPDGVELADDEAAVNLVFAYMDIITAALSKQNPNPVAQPRDARYERSSDVAEAALSYLIWDLRLKAEVEKVLHDGIMSCMGGFLWVGYHAEFGYAPDDPTSDEGSQVGRDDALVEHDQFIKAEHPWITRWPGIDIAFDPNARDDITNAAWIARRIRRPVEDALNDKRLRKDVVLKVVGSDANGQKKKKPDKLIEEWEIWDRRTGTVFRMSDKKGQDRFLADPTEWPYDLDGFPCLHFKLIPLNDDVYQMSPIRVFEPLVREINRLRRNFLKKSDRTVPKILYEDGAVDEHTQVALESNEPMEFVKCNNINGFKFLEQPNIMADERALLQELWFDFRFTTGISEQQAGIQSSESVTATEVLSRQQFSLSRIGRLRKRFEELWSEVLRKLLLLIQQFWPPDKLIPIFDAKGQRIEDWTTWDADTRNAEFALIAIEADSTAPPTKESQKAQVVQAANTFAQVLPALAQTQQMLQASGIAMDIKALIKDLMRPYDDVINNWDDIFPDIGTTQDPHQELRALMNGAEVAVSETDIHQQHVIVHLRQRQELLRGDWNEEFDDVSELNQVSEGLSAHVKEHQAAIQLSTPGSPQFDNAVAPPGGNSQGGDGTTFGAGATGGPALAGRANSMRNDTASNQIAATLGRQGGGQAENLMNASSSLGF